MATPRAALRGAARRSSRRGRHTTACRAEAGAVENVVVVGSGPAGYTAAIYAGRANLKPLVFEGFQKGGVPGGQLMTTTEVENFPGFPEGITGPALMERMRQQAERWGAELVTEDVDHIDLSQRPFVVKSADRTVKTNTIILATGATARRLGIPSEHEFWSRGISACAICDGASPVFKGQEVAVVGGGDTATEEAVYLTKYASHVHLLVRGPEMRASKAMQDRAIDHERVTVHYNTEVADAFADSKGAMGGLRLRDTQTGEERDLPVRGLFYGIGHRPNSDLVAGQVELTESGYVAVSDGARTSVEGVFSAGDLHDTEWRQAITAAGSGCMAAISTERYLTEKDLLVEYKGTATGAAAREVAAGAAAGEAEEQVAASSEEDFDPAVVRHKGQFALRKLYHESERVILVMYTAPTCGPCSRLKPMLDTVVDEYGDNVHYIQIDIEEDPEIAEAAGVMGTPTVQIFHKKERIGVLNGMKMKSEYRKVIDTVVDLEVASRA